MPATVQIASDTELNNTQVLFWRNLQNDEKMYFKTYYYSEA